MHEEEAGVRDGAVLLRILLVQAVAVRALVLVGVAQDRGARRPCQGTQGSEEPPATVWT